MLNIFDITIAKKQVMTSAKISIDKGIVKENVQPL